MDKKDIVSKLRDISVVMMDIIENLDDKEKVAAIDIFYNINSLTVMVNTDKKL